MDTNTNYRSQQHGFTNTSWFNSATVHASIDLPLSNQQTLNPVQLHYISKTIVFPFLSEQFKFWNVTNLYWLLHGLRLRFFVLPRPCLPFLGQRSPRQSHQNMSPNFYNFGLNQVIVPPHFTVKGCTLGRNPSDSDRPDTFWTSWHKDP